MFRLIFGHRMALGTTGEDVASKTNATINLNYIQQATATKQATTTIRATTLVYKLDNSAHH